MCGGATSAVPYGGAIEGLSPRVRGSHIGGPLRRRDRGSIPACAGEPISVIRTAFPTRVYPRVCGGAVEIVAGRVERMGLSPRVRGSLRSPIASRQVIWVYPRVCGGAQCLGGQWSSFSRGSIPACAGEPGSVAGQTLSIWVYPRVCGGALNPDTVGGDPRVCGGAHLADRFCYRVYPRAGEPRHVFEVSQSGSIPACAGEPLSNI